ncbi:pseudouridine synthase [Ochromonadaceae sp. CCMP2298]|nr:pseudouridine synthase [Ochromonadaceae sp. CCMP2298]
MDYVTMLNRCLPPDIRILAWAPVTDDFSARFSASHRTYRYFFPRAKLDILAMQQGACRLLGEHDFSNLCKMDMGNVSNFKREADDAPIDTEADADAEDVYMLELRGVAFLWHMVRCIMAVLFSIGQGREDPSVLDALFDIQGNPGKPAYAMAPEAPLVLHECGFDNLHLHQHPRNLWQLTAHYRDLLASHQVSAARARNALDWVMEQHLVLADATNADADADADADAGAGANTHTGPTHTASAPTTSTSTAPTTAPISAPTTAGAAGLLLLRELVDSVLQQQSRTQQRLISRGITVPTTLTNTATATTTAIATATAGVQMHGGSSSSSSGVGSVGSVGNVGQKRKLGAGGSPTTHTEAVPQTETAGGEGGAEVEAEAEAVGGTDAFMARLLLLACPQGEQGQGGEQGGVRSLRWGQVLHRLEAQCGEPQLKYVPYVPLLQRKREHSYQEKALHLQGAYYNVAYYVVFFFLLSRSR